MKKVAKDDYFVTEIVIPVRRKLRKLADNRNFLRSWVGHPLLTGAVVPSGTELAKTMAAHVDPNDDSPVIELGPGTGPVTKALVQRGVAEERLILVEYDDEFCTLLKHRFPKATIVRGDAYHLAATIDGQLPRPAGAVVSGLPLMTKPHAERLALLMDVQSLVSPGAPFIQFTYALVAPIHPDSTLFSRAASRRIWKNVPPARVWVYRAKTTVNGAGR
ncbi:MAG: phospholipid methyltransferase [Methylobacteriaceae bacterium]|jgi:phosphatidylethanolamine/phosphatidyl-N-methylethanolamine N-methyltransferase|nr:phospholipid methyltransferase [Methylobacteriaceae bacterium]